MVKELVDTAREFVESDLIKIVARGHRKMYQALIEEGFTGEEALKIICQTGGFKITKN